MTAATVTSKGQITIPVDIREMLRLSPGDKVEFYSDHKGQICIRPLNASPTAFLEGLPARSRLSGILSDDQAIAAAVAARHPKARQQAAE